jgi:hypothetical protein
VQGSGAAQRAVSGAAIAALTGQSARVAVSKNTAATQRNTVATPRRGNRKKQVFFNLTPPPLEVANDDEYNGEEDPDYEFDANIDEITLNTEGVLLVSKESAIDSIRRHWKISDSFKQEVASDE